VNHDAAIAFSVGSGISDAEPRQVTAKNFAAFTKALHKNRASSKATARYIAGPLAGRRCADALQPRRWLAADLDRIHADVLPDVRLWFARFSGCGWPTHSSTPEAPRERAILELDREVTRAEGMAIGRVLMRQLQAEFGGTVVVDASTFRGEQPVFLPPEGVALARFDGDPLNVEKYLAAAASLPPEREAPPAAEPAGKVRTGRNEFLSREAYRLRKQGQTIEQIEAVLLAMNSATCEPPLTDAEVQAIARRKRIVAPAPHASPPTPEGVITKLRQFAVTQEQVNNMTDTRMIWRALIALSHLSVWSAPGNGGKTTIAKLAAAELSRDGFTVFFLQEDASAGDLPVLFEHAQEHHYLLLNSTLNGGAPQDQVNTLYELVAADANLSNYVFFFDTLKKYVDIMQKGGTREFFQLMRALTTRGATVVLLGHTNKHRGLDGKLIFEGVGDVRNDVDELLYIESTEDKATARVTMTMRPDKVRCDVKETTFRLDKNTMRVMVLETVIDVGAIERRHAQLKEDADLIAVVRGILKDGGLSSTALVAKVMEIGSVGRPTASRVINRYLGTDPADKLALWMQTYIRENNTRLISLPGETLQT
jgi:hypothetical protein